MADKEQLNILKALQVIRVSLVNMDIKKSGHNDYGKYDYFELSDFLPAIQKLALENGVVCIYRLEQEQAVLMICDIENIDNCITFSIPIAEINLKGANAIQNVGGLTTYTRRYLYMIAFEIAENDEFDPTQNPQEQTEPQKEEEQDVNQQLVTDKDVTVLDKLVQKKGVNPESILDRYRVNTYNEMTFQQFNAAMKILMKMKDADE